MRVMSKRSKSAFFNIDHEFRISFNPLPAYDGDIAIHVGSPRKVEGPVKLWPHFVGKPNPLCKFTCIFGLFSAWRIFYCFQFCIWIKNGYFSEIFDRKVEGPLHPAPRSYAYGYRFATWDASSLHMVLLHIFCFHCFLILLIFSFWGSKKHIFESLRTWPAEN